MSLYDLPKFKFPKIELKKSYFAKFSVLGLIFLVIFLSSIFGFLAGAISGSYFFLEAKDYLQKLNIQLPEPKIIEKYYSSPAATPQISQEEAVIKVVREVSPSVVSIIITKDLPVFEQYYYNPFQNFEEFFSPEFFEFQTPELRQKGVEKKQVGGGTGFIISSDGMILTNKHVVMDEGVDYTVLTNEGERLPAKVLAIDPVKDLAVIKVKNKKRFKPMTLGNSDNIQIGQTVIAIGNALGEFQNTVSVGVVSGLRRTVTASSRGITETLENLIQTDAAINKGNSGGPLLNLKGEVIGMNVAMAQAENIGFAIPVNEAKRDIKQIKQTGKIVYPFLGIRYISITKRIQEENKLPVDYGAWIVQGDQSQYVAITPGSAAEKAGLKENDIILEFNKEKITPKNPLAKIILKYKPGDKIKLKVLQDNKEKDIWVVLGEISG